MSSMSKTIVQTPCGLAFLSQNPVVSKNPHTSDHSPGTPPGHHNGVGPGGTGKLVLTNVSSIMRGGQDHCRIGGAMPRR